MDTETAAIIEKQSERPQYFMVLDRTAPIFIPEEDLLVERLIHFHATDSESDGARSGILDFKLLFL